MKFALTCPGQGFIRAKLLQPYLKHHNAIRHVLDEVDEALGVPFSRQISTNDHNWMLSTSNAQPAIMTATVATNTILNDVYGVSTINTAGRGAAAVLGHSLGEYTALVLNGTLSLTQGVQLVRLRGQLLESLQQKLPGYTMKVLLFRPAHFDAIREKCLKAGILANINSTAQIVVSGDEKAIQKTVDDINTPKRLISRTTSLPVQIPFHSSVLADIEPRLFEFMAKEPQKNDKNDPKVPIISNLTGSIASPAEAVYNVISVNSRPVQWVQSMNTLEQLGVDTIVNLGPGTVLHGLFAKSQFQSLKIDTFEDDDLAKLQQLT